MTCQHCETEILDGEHRCARCGRRVRATPLRSSLYTATATAVAYDFSLQPEPQFAAAPAARTEADTKSGQQTLFSTPVNAPKVIAFDSLTSPSQKESIRVRAAEARRPAPLKTGKVEVRHARPRRNHSPDQRHLDFLGREAFFTQDEVLSQPQSSIICDAPVAPVALRIRAAVIDCLCVLPGVLACLTLFKYAGGQLVFDKHTAPFLLAAFLTVPLFYKALWTMTGSDSAGMRAVGMRLVDFDGNPPGTDRRYYRCMGSIISLLAAGLGMLWVLVDEDGLSWHDHMSGTFPTLAAGVQRS